MTSEGEAWPGESGQSQDPNNRRLTRKLLSDHSRFYRIFDIASTPTFQDMWKRRLISDWQLSTIVTAQTGPWLSADRDR